MNKNCLEKSYKRIKTSAVINNAVENDTLLSISRAEIFLVRDLRPKIFSLQKNHLISDFWRF